MNRATKAREYLSKRLNDFSLFKNLENSKAAFFDGIIHFKESIILELNKFAIFDREDIKTLESLLNEIDTNRSMGGGGQRVYHTTWIKYGEVHSQIEKLINRTSTLKVPLKLQVVDILKSRPFIIAISAVILASILQAVIMKII